MRAIVPRAVDRETRTDRESTRSIRGVIWLKTGLVLALYGIAIWIVYEGALSSVVEVPLLAILLAFTAVQFSVIAVLLAALLVTKLIRSARHRRILKWLPVVRQRMIDHVAGEDHNDELSALFRLSPSAVEQSAVDLLATISGSELQRLTELLVDIGLEGRWRKRSHSLHAEKRRRAIAHLGDLAGGHSNGSLREALNDPVASVRLEAARGLLRSEEIGDIERVFSFATDEPPLVRAVLVEDLRGHALHLSEQAIPRALSSPHPQHAVVALEMIAAWQKSLPARGVGTLLRHPRPEVRARATRVLPYVTSEVDVERETLAALADESDDVRVVAAAVAGRLGLSAAVLPLARQLHSSNPGVAVAAAYGLAEIGGEGIEVLETEVKGDHSIAAEAALEALEKVRTSRLHLTRL
jgi:HEAT repeat protein